MSKIGQRNLHVPNSSTIRPMIDDRHAASAEQCSPEQHEACECLHAQLGDQDLLVHWLLPPTTAWNASCQGLLRAVIVLAIRRGKGVVAERSR
uniref:Uncharacterized protein n=1 Tax=Romanomermis culicivorax TaxID=13658 RepID=A0A915J2L6_ROMCU